MKSTYMDLKRMARDLPDKPGIYFFLGDDRQVLYIGKARSLQHRVRSYFLPTSDAKIHNLLTEARDIDYILTESEREAAFLENNFIQQYQPKFNERLKDDKSFPYLKLTAAEPYPGIYLTRKVEADGARYFGPFSPANQARKTIHLLNSYFGIRICRENIPGRRRRPCLEHDLKLCTAPCVGFITEKGYQENVTNALLFLEGRVEELLPVLRKKMENAAARLDFEEAGHWRDLIFTLEQIKEKPRFISVQSENKDIIGFARTREEIAVYFFLMRKGKVIQSESLLLERARTRSDKSHLEGALSLFYHPGRDLPDKILLPFPLDPDADLPRRLSARRSRKLDMLVPRRGKNKKLVELANRNAALLLEKTEQDPLKDLQNLLGLDGPPGIIEGYDISNTGGQESVGSRVVFKQGAPCKSEYRKYRIKTVSGPNDVASLREVLQRRFSSQEKRRDPPDLVLVDGGLGQFHAAEQALSEMGMESLPLISLAKREEIIYADKHRRGLRLDRTSPALKLVQSIRDEAHRFALAFHRRRRTRKSFSSYLDGIPGIGPKRKQLLLTRFRNQDEILAAPQEELTRLLGETAARSLRRHLGSFPNARK